MSMAAQKRENQTMIQPSTKRFKKHHYLHDHHHHHHGDFKSRNMKTTRTINLPDDVLDNIFSFLPIKNAVQIGVLSTRFKNSWLFSRNLFFDKDFARGRGRTEFIAIVDRVLNSHAGVSIKSFRLYFDSTGFEYLVQKWIKNAVERGAEELDLDFCQARERFRFSFEFLDVKTIRVLKLSYWEVDLPPKLKGLGSLNTLVLRKVDVSAEAIETVFLNCMVLETLDIVRCNRIQHLKILGRDLKRFKVLKVGDCLDIFRIDIDAPTLTTIYYCGNLCRFNFANIFQLKDVMLNFTPSRSFIQPAKVRNLVFDLSHIHVLTITSTFLEGLSAKFENGEIREEQFCLYNLKELQLFMEGTSFCNLYDIASFLKNCPCMEKVFIDLGEFSFECGLYYELHQKHKLEQYYQSLHHLKFIKVKGFKYQNHELELVNFLLRKATFLETLVLVVPPKNTNIKFYTSNALYFDQFFLSIKASPKAKIIRSESLIDRSFIYPKHMKIWY